jgi:RNA polymerase sigma factor (sigma-70 family)
VFEALNANARTIRIPTNVIQKTLQDAFNNDEPDKVTASINLTKSYDTVLGEDGDTLIDVLYNKDEKLFDEDYDKTNSPSLRNKLLDMLDVLTEKEKEIIMMYYGFNGCKMTLQDIGDEYNLTKERIRQIKETSLRKLRSESKDLFEFLEN